MADAGSLVVSWLVQQGVTCIPVLSRTGHFGISQLGDLLSPENSAFSALVSILRCDSSGVADMAALSHSLGRRHLSAMVHAGGVLDDAVLAKQRVSSIRKVKITWPSTGRARHMRRLCA